MASLGKPEHVVEKVFAQFGQSALIAICVPSLGMVSVPWHSRMLLMGKPMNTRYANIYCVGKPVAIARNNMVQTALHELEDRVSHIFFVDDDVLVPEDALLKLMAHNLPIVAGLYYAKRDSVDEALVFSLPGEGLMEFRRGDLVQCWGHGMGCTLIKREVFETLAPHVGLDAEGNPEFFRTVLFGEEKNASGDMVQMTEDMYFCALAGQHGFQPTVDSSVFCWHWDQKKGTGYPRKAWERYCESLSQK